MRRTGLLLFLLAALGLPGCGEVGAGGPGAGGLRVRGTTLDARTREAIAGVVVHAPAGVHALSGPDGRFLLEGIPPEPPVLVVGRLPDGREAEVRIPAPLPAEMEVVLHLELPPLPPAAGD